MADMRSKREWNKWQELCEALVRCGAVKETDLTKKVDDTTTDGTALLGLIRDWGKSLVDLHDLGIDS